MKRIITIILILSIIIIIATILTACDGRQSNVGGIDRILATPNSTMADFEIVEYNWYEAILVDKTTGVMYVWITTSSGGITPLYNADGTLKNISSFDK